MSRARRPVPILVVGALVGGLLAAGSPGTSAAPAGPAAERPVPLAVTGFALGSLRSRTVARNADALTTLTVAGVGITADGRRVGVPGDDVARLSRVAAREGVASELVVSNYSNRLEAFDPRAAHRLLSSPASIERVARLLAGHVGDQGWGGVNVDLELVRAGDAGGLVALVDALQSAMPAERTVSVDVSAATSVRGYRERGYAMRALGRAADVVVVMAYDQHGPTWSGPGPIGSLDWQRRSLRAALAAGVPAERLDLGVAGYGYSWPARGTGRSLTVGGARKAVARDDARAVWHPRVGEWSARLSGGTVLWWSDRRSYRQRVLLARELGVRGVALWRLGSADNLGSAPRPAPRPAP